MFSQKPVNDELLMQRGVFPRESVWLSHWTFLAQEGENEIPGLCSVRTKLSLCSV